MLPIFLNGQTVGECTLSGNKIQAKCKGKKGFIYRLRIYDNAGKCFPLGVMMPSGDSFSLERSLPADFLLSGFSSSRCEIFRSCPSEEAPAFLPFALSHGESINGVTLTPDSLLSQCLDVTKEVKCGTANGKIYVYFPFEIGGESVMAPFFFCLNVYPLGSSFYAVFCLDEEGLPCLL